MTVDTIILDEFDQLLSDSQYHFVDKIIHYVPREHQLIYMSATAKFKQDKIVENTIQIKTENQQLDNIRHFICKLNSATKLNACVS